MAPPTSLQWKDFLATKLAKVVQSMQITIWAAFQGYIVSEQEVLAADLARLIKWDPEDAEQQFNDYDDPFLAEFLAQEDFQEVIEEDQVDLFEELDAKNACAGTTCPRTGCSNSNGNRHPSWPVDDLWLDRRRLAKNTDIQNGTVIASQADDSGETKDKRNLRDVKQNITSTAKHFVLARHPETQNALQCW